MERLCEDAAGAARGQARLALQRVRLYALPAAVRLAALALAVLFVFPVLRAGLLGPPPHAFGDALHLLLLTALPALVLPAWWQQRRHDSLIARADHEPALNERAIEALAGPDFARVQLAGEIARETVWLPGWRPRWLLVTNRRLLLFTGGARERHLLSEWPRRSVLFAGPTAPRAARRPVAAGAHARAEPGPRLHHRHPAATALRQRGDRLAGGAVADGLAGAAR